MPTDCRLALLIAGLAVSVLPVSTAQVSARGFSMAGEELKIFSSCTLQLEPMALASRTLMPSGALFVRDDSTLLALVIFFVLGMWAMYTDYHEFSEDEVSPKTKERTRSTSQKALPMWQTWPIAVVIIVLSMVAASSVPAVDQASVQCMRVPLHVPPQTPLHALSEYAFEELLQLSGTRIGRQPVTPGSDTCTGAFILTFILIGLGTMHADVQEMAKEEQRSPSSKPRTREDSSPSSGRRGGKRSSRCSSRTFLCVAVAVMALLAMMPARERMAALPDLGEYAIEELSVNTTRLTRRVEASARDKTTRLQGEAPPDCIVALIVSIIAAVGCKVCHGDLLDMQAEEQKRQHQALKNAKKNARQEPYANDEGAEIKSSPFFSLPLMLRVALGFAMLGNIVLFAFAAHSGWLQSDYFNPAAPSTPGLARLVRRSVPFAQQRGLSGIMRVSMPLASDEVTVLSLAVFALIGIIIFCIDFARFVDEEKAKREAKQDQGSSFSKDPVKEEKSWLVKNWRMVSCVVMLLSMFASTVAQLWEGAM